MSIISKIEGRLVSFVMNKRLRRLLVRQNLSFGHSISVIGRLPVLENRGSMHIGSNTGFRSTPLPPELYTSVNGRLVIGNNTFINGGCCIHASKEVILGERCLLAEGVMIADYTFHEISPCTPAKLAPIVIGSNVWLGVRALVMPGVTIGDHSVIGAGAVVTRSIPERSVAAGSPARVIRTFDCPTDWRRA